MFDTNLEGLIYIDLGSLYIFNSISYPRPYLTAELSIRSWEGSIIEPYIVIYRGEIYLDDKAADPIYIKEEDNDDNNRVVVLSNSNSNNSIIELSS